MKKRPSRKGMKPTRTVMRIADIPDNFELNRDELFPLGAPPIDFCQRVKDNNIRLDLWELVRGIAWWHMVNMYRAESIADGKQITGELNFLANQTEEMAINFENIDIDTMSALLPHIPKPNYSTRPENNKLIPEFFGGEVRLKAVISELREFAEYCDNANKEHQKTRVRKCTQVQQDTINQFAEDWDRLIERPAKTIDNDFHHACKHIGKKLKFQVSERMFKQAIDMLRDNTGEKPFS